MEVLILGGAGFLGHEVARLLDDEDADYGVTVLDRLLYNHEYLKPHRFIYGDITDRKLMAQILPRYDVVINLAAIVGDPACAVMHDMAQAVNIDAVQTIADNFPGRLIHMSSCSVYGASDEFVNEDSPLNPLSFYAESKIRSEEILKGRALTTIFRLATLHGFPRGRIRTDLVVNRLVIKSALTDEISIFGEEQWRPFLHVSDAAYYITNAVFEDRDGTYNLVHENMTIGALADRIATHFPAVRINRSNLPDKDRRNYKVLAKREFFKMYKPFEGVDRTINDGICLVTEGRVVNFDHAYYSNVAHLSTMR